MVVLFDWRAFAHPNKSVNKSRNSGAFFFEIGRWKVRIRRGTHSAPIGFVVPIRHGPRRDRF